MTFQNIDGKRVFQAVGIIFIIALILTFAIPSCYTTVRMVDAMSQLDPDATADEQTEQLQEEIDALLEELIEGSPTVNIIGIIPWLLTALVTFIVAQRTARRVAISPEQAVGYGVSIGVGVLLIYGLCICNSAVTVPVKLLFAGLIPMGGAFGGQFAGQNLSAPATAPASDSPSLGVPGLLAKPQPGSSPDIHYNMGVQAALGGRREEARQHFTRVLQMQPRHVAAWLQLANLSDTPEQAWNYIQQARSISPNDPAVREAVNIIWPQVSAKAEGKGPPTLQPPYQGAGGDDTEIPRSVLPPAPPSTPPKPDTDTTSDTDPDSRPSV